MTPISANAPPRLSLADAAFAAALLLLVGGLFHHITAGFWRGDDPAIVLHALQSPGLAAFFDPADWQKISPSNLTPWITLSFKLDLALAGVSPRAFYLHQLVSTGLLALTAYGLGRQWLPPAWAALVVALGLLGAPTAGVVDQLMTRHYLEGLVLALLSLLAWVQAERRASMGWALAGAVAYALAATAKEVYVPLLLVLPWLARPAPGQKPAQAFRRWLRLLPFVAVAAAYVLWRRHMLGNPLGGYGEAQSVLSAAALLAWVKALAGLPSSWFGDFGAWALAAWMLAAGLGWHALATRRRRMAAMALACMLGFCLFGPLLPLALWPGLPGTDLRYLFLPWWAASAAIGAALHGASSFFAASPAARPVRRSPTSAPMPGWRLAPIGGLALGLLFAVGAALQARRHASLMEAGEREFSALGRFLVAADERSAFIPSPAMLAGYWYVDCLCEIRKLQGTRCPQALIPGWPLAGSVQHLAIYDAQTGAMADITGRLEAEQQRAASLDTTRPLSIDMRLEQGWARWHLGPYTDGQYFVVSPTLGGYPLPPSGQIRTVLRQAAFQIQYESPAGWRTRSPVLTVELGQPVVWTRGSPDAAR
jgi:hypothetical protein